MAFCVGRTKQNAPPLPTGAARATTAMGIGFGFSGDIGMDDDVDLRDVDPARRHIGCDQYPDRAALEGFERLGALGLRQLSTEGKRGEAILGEFSCQLGRIEPASDEDQRPLVGREK